VFAVYIQVVFDKGTFDAISLSDKQEDAKAGYKKSACKIIKAGGFFIITSCNFTQTELIQFFATTSNNNDEHKWMEYVGHTEEPKFRFGGVEGATVATVCFSVWAT